MANKTLRTLGSGSAVSDGDLFLSRQGGDTVDKRVTSQQIRDYLVAYLQSELLLENTVVVKSAADLASIDSTKNYVIDGVIDMGSSSITVPAGGIYISGPNGARDTAKLFSSSLGHTMFVSPGGGYSGDVVLESCTIETTGAGSKVFGLDNAENQGALDINGVNFINCTSLGELSSYRQFATMNVGFIACDDGFTFNGTWSGGLSAVDTIAIQWPAATLFSEGTALTFGGSVRSNVNFLSVNAGATLFDFQPANILRKGGFFLNGVRNAATNAIPNFPASSSYARFKDNEGIKNTYVGGQWFISTQAATVISGISVPVKIAGTTTYNDMQWFTNTTNNAFVYGGNQTIDVEIKGNLSFSGTNGDVINIYVRQWDASAAAYIDLSETAGSTLNAAGRAEGVAFNGIGTLDNGDRIELWVENESAIRNVTALNNGYVILSERPS